MNIAQGPDNENCHHASRKKHRRWRGGAGFSIALLAAACSSGGESTSGKASGVGGSGGADTSSASTVGGSDAGGAGGSGASGGGTSSSGTTGGGGGGGGGGTGPVPPTPCPDIGLDPMAGTIHYVCDCGPDADADCENGNDNNSGTSPTQPWRSYEKARSSFASLAAGDSVAFCRGGAFSPNSSSGNHTRWVNENCQAGNPCVVRDYQAPWASGDEQRPIISSSGNGFRFEDTGAPDHEEGVTILNLDLRGSDSGRGFFFYNDISDVLMCNVRIEGFGIGVLVGPLPNKRIVLRNSEVLNNGGQGWLGGCDDCGIAHSTFKNNGFETPVYNHNVYFSSSASDMFAIGNELYQSTIVNGECRGVSFVVHGTKERLRIEDNYIHEDVDAQGANCAGIMVDASYPSTAEAFTDLVIRNNTLVNVGYTAIGVNACQDCLIENNVVVQMGDRGQWAISAPDKPRADNDLPMTNITIRNNSLFFGPGAHQRAIRLGGEGTGHVVVNNAVSYAGTQSSHCLNLDLPPSAYDAVDNNICHQKGSGTYSWAPGMSLESWRNATGFDMNSSSNDPGFADPAGLDLSPVANSVMIDAGHSNLSSADDHDGVLRDATPDIGAFEFQP